jgi:hypothetical protein
VPSPLPLFLLDENFPASYIRGLPFPGLRVRPLGDVHPDLTQNHQDWQVMQQIRARGQAEGWITLDRRMLNLEKEMVILHQTKLSMVVFEGAGNDPFIALGLLLIHINPVAASFVPHKPQLWVLRTPGTKAPISPWERLDELARRKGVATRDLYDQNKLSRAELDLRSDMGTA